MKQLLSTLILFLLMFSLSAQTEDPGVSYSLALRRSKMVTELEYNLFFSIPQNKHDDIEAEETISFHLNDRQDVVLDFRENPEKIHSVRLSAKKASAKKVSAKKASAKKANIEWRFENEHIIIPKKYTKKGRNAFCIMFTAGNQSLNRNDEYMYTLFVPDRARTCFPCFDQPDMKARFRLSLALPSEWVAVGNSKLSEVSTEVAKRYGVDGDSRKMLATTGSGDILPTYLFAFAAGKFNHKEYEEDGRRIGAYYRETDPERLDQLSEIFHQVIHSLKWQEEFTQQKYGFEKYDFVILPGFQFGGMEHTGCTFYNDNTLFLSNNPTPDELLTRASLIAHETSHMWFGDLVTMKWFNDVWTKEVFANYFAAAICRPLFPNINHDLNWLKTFKASAMSEDRTDGRTAIQQPLSNMRDAGLIYNNIIYNKAPIVMRRIVEMMGDEAFRRGIQRYVKRYAYGNATWDDLIDILDEETTADLKSYSDKWVKSPCFPTIKAQSARPNADGSEYGFIEMTQEQMDTLMNAWSSEKDATARQSFLMTLHENYLHHRINHNPWVSFIIDNLNDSIIDPLTCSTLISYLNQPMWQLDSISRDKTERVLWNMSMSHPQQSVCLQLIRLLSTCGTTDYVNAQLYALWKYQENNLLSVNDYMTLAYELALRYPSMAADIISEQRSRLDNPDRLRQFDFISRAVDADRQHCDSLFHWLENPQNRRIEPWTGSVLYYLNHPLREKESVKYIRPALEMLTDIQKTGDIFFPSRWCNSLLAGHRSQEAMDEVDSFLNDHKDYPQLLKNKILVAAYSLRNSLVR